MRKHVTVMAAVVVLAMLTASTAFAAGKANSDPASQPIVQIFDDGESTSGTVTLTRRADGLTATAKVEGLIPGGVYTFWWIVGEAPVAAPDFFAALGGSRVIGESGKATVRMNAEVGQEGIKNFLGDGTTAPFRNTFDLDPMVDEVHVEIAYHGQLDDAGSDVSKWRSDFWTGTACPETGPAGNLHNPGGIAEFVSNPGQPHCPVSYVAIFGTVLP